MNDIQRMKTNFRATKKWSEYRKMRRENDCRDALTHSKLSTRFNLHHMDLNPEHYTDLSNYESYCCLNNKSHDVVHFLYPYYRKDPAILDRLKEILDKMVELNK